MSIDPLAIGRIMNSNLADTERQQIASEEFEGYLIGMLIKEMRKTIPKGMFSSPAMDTFTDMMDQALAKDLASTGTFGFAEAMLSKVHGASESVQDQVEMGMRAWQTAQSPILKDIHTHVQHNHDHHALQPVLGRLTSKFGARFHPIHQDWRSHDGIDIAAPRGSDIQAVLDGTVEFAGNRSGYGKTIVLRHADGRESMYAHCDALFVQAGDVLRAGDKIAEVGSTGVSTGNHLHFELRENGQAIDPLTVFPWLFEE